MIKDYFKLSHGVWIYFFVCILLSIGSGILPFLLLLLNSEFRFSTSDNGMIFCIIMVLLIPACIIGGKFANKHNKKNIIIIFRLFYAMCLLLYTCTDIIIIKLILLSSAFIFIGISNPALNSFVLDMVSEEQSRKAYSLVFMGQNIGSIIGPLITGYLFNKALFLFKIYSLFSVLACLIFLLFITYKFDKQNKIEHLLKDQLTKKKFRGINHITFFILLSFIGFEFCYAQQSFSLPIEMNNIFEIIGARYYGYIVSYNSVLILILTPIITILTKKLSPINSIIISGGFCGFGFGILYYARIIRAGIIILVTLWTIGEILYSINSFIALRKMLDRGLTGTASALILISRSIGICFCSILSGLIIQLKNISMVWK